MEKQPTVPPRKGAKKPIISSEFCDQFQVDLIELRTDIYFEKILDPLKEFWG
jgi:hypothetical protein